MYFMGTNQDFVDYLNGLMVNAGMSQSDLARKINRPRATINGILMRKRGVGVEIATVIAHAFNLPPEELLRHANLIPGKPDQSPTLEEANYKLSLLAPDQQREALEYLDYLLTKKSGDKNGNALHR